MYVRIYGLKREGGELFKKDFRKLLSLEWKYFKKTLIKKSVFQNIKQRHNTGKTIGCLYQLSNKKTEFKEIGIERFHTDVYIVSLQTQSYIQSSQKPWGNPLSNHNLITYTTTKRMTLNTSRHTLSLANTPTLRLLILIPSKTHSQSQQTQKQNLFHRVQGLNLLQKKIWNQYKQDPIPQLWSITNFQQSQLLWKLKNS